MLKPEIWLISKLMFRFGFLHHDNIFDSDAKASIFIVTWLVGYDISDCKRDFGILDSSPNADWSFVNVEI